MGSLFSLCNRRYKFKNILAIVKIQGTNEDGYILCDNRLNKKGLNPNGITTDGFYTWANLRGIDDKTIIFVETESKATKGRITAFMKSKIPITLKEIFSEHCIAILFGASSPKTSEK